MATLAWLAAGLGLLVLALLAVPVEVAFVFERRDGRSSGGGTLRWLFGAVRIPLGTRLRKRPQRRQPEARKTSGRSARAVVAALRSRGFYARVRRLAAGLVRAIRIEALTLDARVGFDDPADTGRLWGLVGPLAAVMPAPSGAHVAIRPEFAEAAFVVEGTGRIRTVPLHGIALVLGFFLSPTVWRALRAARNA